MKPKFLVAMLLALAAGASQATVYHYSTDAHANVSNIGPGASADGTPLFLTKGEQFTISTDPTQLWDAAFTWDPAYPQLHTNADGSASMMMNLMGANGWFTVGIGALVADIGGLYQFVGAGTHTLTAGNDGELLLQYADVNNYDNSGVVNSDVTVSDVPEPASLALLGLGLAGVAGLRRRRQA